MPLMKKKEKKDHKKSKKSQQNLHVPRERSPSTSPSTSPVQKIGSLLGGLAGKEKVMGWSPLGDSMFCVSLHVVPANDVAAPSKLGDSFFGKDSLIGSGVKGISLTSTGANLHSG